MKRVFLLILLCISVLSSFGQIVSIKGDAAVIGNQNIVLTATITPNIQGEWSWKTTDTGLDLSAEHGNVLKVTPSDTGVFVYRALFFDGVNTWHADYKVAVFYCGSQLTDSENQTYSTKLYGSVCWMTENLRSTRYADGSEIPFARAYKDDESLAATYGRLYDYASALRGEKGDTVQGVCPNGWQLPKEQHLNALINNNGTTYDYENGDWLGNLDNNKENFNLTPSGFYNTLASRFENLYGESYLILNSPLSTNNTYRVGGCKYGCPSWLIDDHSSLNGYSVRCIKMHSSVETTDDYKDKLYTIQFFKNGAETDTMLPQTDIGGKTITLDKNLFAHSGNWEFAGWNTKPDGTGVSFTDQDSFVLTQDTILYAQWHTWCTGTPSPIESPTSRIDSVKDIDGNWYNVVQIGNQCWLKENMRTNHYADGTNVGITYVNRDGNNTALYGFLYSWQEATHNAASSNLNPSGVQGVCPKGWHVPSQSEGQQLVKFLEQSHCGCGGDGNTAKALSSTFGWTTDTTACTVGYDQLSNNVSGFSALPAGVDFGEPRDFGDKCYIWLATENPNDNSDGKHIAISRTSMYPYYSSNNRKYCKFSVRCVRDSLAFYDVVVTDSTISSLTINVDYVSIKALQSATVNAYMEETCDNQAGNCTELSNVSTSPIIGKITGLNHNTPYYVKVMLFTADDSLSYVVGPFKTKAIIDTITFVANGSTNSMDKQTIIRDVETPLNECTLTHTGNWQFMGWNTKIEGTGTKYADQANITTNGNDTLYAQWHTWCTGDARFDEMGNSRIDSVKDIDGNWYNVVEIGNQCWLKENMRTNHYADGTTVGITYVNRDGKNTALYGFLYSWQGAMHDAASSTLNPSGVQGVCPKGWHIPSQSEGQQLVKFLEQSHCGCGGNGNTAKALSSTYGWTPNSTTCTVGYDQWSNNVSGFSAMPAGNDVGVAQSFGESCAIWLATENPNDNRDGKHITIGRTNMYPYYATNRKYCKFSVRCVRSTLDTITFMPNGGSGNISQQVVVNGEETPLNECTFTHTGNWQFVGWNTKVEGTGTMYANQGNFTTYGNDTLYAQWHTWCTGTPVAMVETGNARIDSVKDIDGNWYNVVQIGNQCWLKENMRTKRYADGRNVNGYQVPSNVDDGLRYNWFAALDTTYTSLTSQTLTPTNTQGICPTGWHVPTNADWDALYYNYGRPISKLATTYGWKASTTANSPGYDQSKNNVTGFNMYPNGCEGALGESVSFWCSTVRRDYNFPIRLYYNYNRTDWGFYFGSSGNMKLSVRCLRDVNNEKSKVTSNN